MPAVCSRVSGLTLWHTCGSHTKEAHSRTQCEGGGLLSGRWALLESRANEQTSHPERADGKGKGRVKLYGGELQAKSVAVKCWNMSGWSVGAREAKVRLKRWVSCQPWSSGIC